MTEPTLEQIAAQKPADAVDWATAQLAVVADAVIEVRKDIDEITVAVGDLRNLVIGLGIDTTEETERLDAHVSALETITRPGRGPARSYPPTQWGWDQAMADMGALQQQFAESRAAMESIVSVLGTGECKANTCEGCRWEHGEAVRIAADALATTSEESPGA